MDKNIELIVKTQEGNDRLLPITDCENVLNLSSKIAHDAMPSDYYIILSLPTSGKKVIAPADGYFTLTARSTATNGCVRLARPATNEYNMYSQACFGSNQAGITVTIPARQGTEIIVTYQYCDLIGLRFIYANGCVPST